MSFEPEKAEKKNCKFAQILYRLNFFWRQRHPYLNKYVFVNEDARKLKIHLLERSWKGTQRYMECG